MSTLHPRGTAPGTAESRPVGPFVTPSPPEANPLYRREAVQAHLNPMLDAVPLRVAPPWAAGIVLLVASLVVVAVILACSTDVDVTSRGRGILRARGGAQILSCEVAGLVASVHAHSGDLVEAGAIIVELSSAAARARTLEAESRVELARATVSQLEGRQMQLFDERIAMMKDRGRLLRRHISIQSVSIDRAKRKLQTYELATNHGVTSAVERDQRSEELATAMRDRLGLREQWAQAQLQMTDAIAELEEQVWKARTNLREASAAKDAIALSLQQLTIRAPRAGRIEALLVQPGDALPAGSLVGKLVPSDAILEIVAFVPERDRVFVKEGAEARVELDQLPVAEFGPLTGTVHRVATEIATAEEVQGSLSDKSAGTEPVYRVELALKPDAQARRLSSYLRSGSLLSVRHSLRHRRVITLLFEPLQKWFR